MTLDQLILKFQERSAEFTRRAAPYALKQELVAKAWLGRAHEADEIVRDLQQLKEAGHAVQRMPAKARSHRRSDEADRSEAQGAEADGGDGSAEAPGD